MIVEGVCLEETEGCDCCDCDRRTLPFRFKYFFSKDPCEKCLVKAACNFKCEEKFAHQDRLHSIKEWKKKKSKWLSMPLNFAFIWFVISLALFFLVMNSGCKQVNQKRAVEYYDQHVKNFPEENP
jgi:hypothetical protein